MDANAEIERLAVKVKLLKEIMDVQSGRIAELERMVFGTTATPDRNMEGIVESNRLHPVFKGIVGQFQVGA